MECGELLYGMEFPLAPPKVPFKSYIRPEIQYGSTVWCLKENEIRIMTETGRPMLTAMCRVQLDIRKTAKDDDDGGFEWNNRSIVNGKQHALVWSCHEKARLKVKGTRWTKRDIKEAGCGRMCVGRFEQTRRTLSKSWLLALVTLPLG